VLLECARPEATEPPSDFSPLEPCTRLFTAPLRVCVANQPDELGPLFAAIERAVAAGHYAAGFFAYESAAFFEPKANLLPSLPGQPLAWFGIYDRPHLFDHCTGVFPEGNPPGLEQATTPVDLQRPDLQLQLDATLALTEQQYAGHIDAIHQLIRSGDVYQLNFTVPLRIQVSGSPAALYQHLRSRQPTPYCAFLHTEPNRRILSFSPELFFRLENQGETRRILTRPMKGTAPRGRTTSEDRAQSEWLRNDPKNRSENVMIVDLLRNDLGRLCRYGSVRAHRLFAIERYPTLWQMTSAITGELRPQVDFHQVFRALFPCGSITGAPKVRAMQLLADLEGQPRGIYTGAIGFFSKERTVFSVAIRTLELDSGSQESDCMGGTMGVGSGIVIDSDPASEFRECLLKADFLARTPQSLSESFSLVESLLWHNGYPLIEFHLDRLEDSAHYLAFPCNRTETKSALHAHAAAFRSQEPRKVRLLLQRDGALQITDESLPDFETPLRVRIALQRTDPRNPMLFHKTTHRPHYAEAFQAAVRAGYDDVLFLNLRGEVTEAGIHNIFIRKDGRLFTPPIECGLLAGVQRRHVLQTEPSAEERLIYLHDLRHAEAIYLSNAVRGLRPAVVDWEN